MEALKAANLGIRFLVELCALAALGYWGVHLDRGMLVKVGAGLGAPLLAALIWGAFVAPKASLAVTGPLRLLLEAAVLGSAVAALYAAGRPSLAWTLGLVVVVNRLLMFVWKQ